MAFITNQGLFEPTVMFFGLTNSPMTFQAIMNTIFANEMAQGWLTIYMDDIAIHTWPKHGETTEQHLQHHRDKVEHVLQTLQDHDLFLQLEKCSFEQSKIEFLGICIKEGTVHMEEHKVNKVKNWEAPRNVREIHEFLGFTGYYH